MNILFVTDHPFSENERLYYSGGGIPSSMLQRYMRPGINLSVVGRKSSKQNKTLASIPNSTFHLLENYSSPKDVIVKRAALKREILSLLDGVDGVVMRLPSALCVFVHKLCTQKGIPVSAEVCGSAYGAYHFYGNMIGKVMAPITERLHRNAVKESSHVLYVTQKYLQDSYPCAPSAKTVACSNVYIDSIDEQFLADRLAKISNFDASNVIIGQIGNTQVSYKGYNVTFKAMVELKKKGINIKYHVVGAGDPSYMLSQAEALGLKGDVKALGPLNHDSINVFFKSIDIYVHPSFQEGLSRSVVEAMSCATPVLSSNVAAASELLSEEYLHEAGDCRTLASQIERLIQSPDELSVMAKNNIEHAKDYLASLLKVRRDAYYDDFFSLCANNKSK